MCCKRPYRIFICCVALTCALSVEARAQIVNDSIVGTFIERTGKTVWKDLTSKGSWDVELTPSAIASIYTHVKRRINVGWPISPIGSINLAEFHPRWVATDDHFNPGFGVGIMAKHYFGYDDERDNKRVFAEIGLTYSRTVGLWTQTMVIPNGKPYFTDDQVVFVGPRSIDHFFSLPVKLGINYQARNVHSYTAIGISVFVAPDFSSAHPLAKKKFKNSPTAWFNEGAETRYNNCLMIEQGVRFPRQRWISGVGVVYQHSLKEMVFYGIATKRMAGIELKIKLI